MGNYFFLKLKIMSYENSSYTNWEKQTDIPVAGGDIPSQSGAPPMYEPYPKEYAQSSLDQRQQPPPEQYIPDGTTEVEGVGFDEVNRKPFLIKVIVTVCLQMCVCAAIIAWLLKDENSLCYVQTETWVFWVGMFAAPIVCGITFCVPPLVKKFPLNMVTLVVWTFLFSFFIAMVATIWVFAPGDCYCIATSANQTGDFKLSHSWCVDEALGVIAPAAIGTGVIFFSTVIITLCGFDIIKHFKIFLIIYFVLSWPLGFLGFLFLPIDVYWAILSVAVIYGGTVGILVTLRLIVSNKYGFSPDMWVYASMYIFMQIGRIFIYLLAIIGGSD